MTDFAGILDKVNSAKNIVITGHQSPDADCISSTLALRELLRFLGKVATVAFEEEVPKYLRFLPFTDEICTPDSLSGDVDLLFVVDCSDTNRCGIAKWQKEKNLPYVVIDHHRFAEHSAVAALIDAEESSAAQMVFDFYAAVACPLTLATATLLYAGISADTGRFTYTNATKKTFLTVAELMEFPIETEEIRFAIFENFSEKGMRLLSVVLERIKLEDGICYSYIDAKTKADLGIKPGDYDSLVTYLLYLPEAKIGILFDELAEDNKIRVNLRCKNGLNVAVIAASLGGGGHIKAAGVRICLPLDEAMELVLDRTRELR